MNGKQEAALEGFNNYLSRFPRGMFRIQAGFYRGEILFQKGEIAKAGSDYEKVLEAPGSFTETTHLRLSYIYFEQKAYQKALLHFEELKRLAGNPQHQLTALTGIMRCHHYLGQDAQAMAAAGELLASPQATDRLIVEAHLVTARSKMALGDPQGAASSFEITTKLSPGEMGAEAKYYLCYLNYQSGDMEASEKAIFELINQYPAYDHWMAKGFILLADVYIQSGNDFQAKQTLRSVIENHEGPALVKMAKEKLAGIEKREAELLQPETKEENKQEDFEDLF
jgi:tetratricopeptide (TPR) repeat protein